MIRISVNYIFILIVSSVLSFTGYLQGDEAVEKTFKAQFSPPEGWHFTEKDSLPKNVLTMIVGKGEKEFPPSINLGTEQFEGTLKDYLKIVKALNDSQGDEWKDLGMIQTESGPASLSQLLTKSKWGEVKMMHVILIRDKTVFIMTAAALKDEFPKFYPDFFRAMRSLKLEESVTGKPN